MKRTLIVLLLLYGQAAFAQVAGQPQVQVSPSGVPFIIQKASNTSTGSVASLAKAFTNANTKGNSIVVVCGVGNGTAPTVTDTLSNTYSQAAQVANGTAFNVSVLYAVNIASGANTVTVNNGGTTASIAMEIYEVAGLLALSPQVVDQTATATSAAATTSPQLSIVPTDPNEYSFVAFGLGTAAQTITVTAATGYTNDSGQLNPATPAGLFSFVSASKVLSDAITSSPSATVGTGEPWAVAVASFQTVNLPIGGTVSVRSYVFEPVYSATVRGLASAASATDIAVLPGTATKTVVLVGVEISCTQTTAGIIDVQLIKRSSADTAGTSTAMGITPHSSRLPAAVSAPLSYTANPTLGSTINNIDTFKLACLAPATATPADIYIGTARLWGGPIFLYTTAEQVAVNLNGVTVTGSSFNIVFHWLEF